MADYIAPKESGVTDWIGAFAVTTGLGLKAFVEQKRDEGDDYTAIMAQALADRLAESFAEWLHLKTRTELWGYAQNEQLNNEALIQEQYQTGPRPVIPHVRSTRKNKCFLLDVPEVCGITLTEHIMWPAASVCGWYLPIQKQPFWCW